MHTHARKNILRYTRTRVTHDNVRHGVVSGKSRAFIITRFVRATYDRQRFGGVSVEPKFPSDGYLRLFGPGRWSERRLKALFGLLPIAPKRGGILTPLWRRKRFKSRPPSPRGGAGGLSGVCRHFGNPGVPLGKPTEIPEKRSNPDPFSIRSPWGKKV